MGLVPLPDQADVHGHGLDQQIGRQLRCHDFDHHRAGQGPVLPARQQILQVDGDDEDSSDSALISRIVSLVVVPETGEVLCASANGYGKRTPVDDFPTKKRGGKGVIAIKTSERNGELVCAVAIDESKELMLISDGGTLVRTRASEVAQTGRNAQGVRLIRLGENETLVGVEAIEAVEEDEFVEAIEGAESLVAETDAVAETEQVEKDGENSVEE